MSTARAQIIRLLEKGVLAPENIDVALRVTQVVPTAQSWRRFIEQLLMWIGGLSIAVSIVFFFAYNWADLGRFAKFALAQAFIVGAVLVYWRWQQHALIAPVALLVASIGLGALLALYGQTYQTGADPWQLFFYWAVLMLPWTIISGSAVLWLMVVVLLNISMALYFASGSRFTFTGSVTSTAMWLSFLFNAGVLIVWEGVLFRQTSKDNRWAPRLVAILATMSLGLIVTVYIAGSEVFGHWVALVAIISVIVAYRMYRFWVPDLFMLALGCLWLIWVVNFFIINQIIRQFNFGVLFIIALLFLGSGALASTWLRSTYREMQQ